jgi:hypothetical protein
MLHFAKWTPAHTYFWRNLMSTKHRMIFPAVRQISSEQCLHIEKQAAAVEETEDIKELDRLLRTVSELYITAITARTYPTHPESRANPSYKAYVCHLSSSHSLFIGFSALPVRESIPWAQALLDQAHTADQTDHARPHELLNLPPRSMHDSYTETMLPFASDPQLFEQYTNASGGIRTGKLFEHLDSLAGSISYKHLLGPHVQSLGRIADERGFYIVTAAVDRCALSFVLIRNIYGCDEPATKA